MASSGLYLENYLESLESLPNELQRNFHNMRELDQKVQETMRKIDMVSDEFLRTVKSLSPDKKTNYVNDIKRMYNRAKEDSEDKLQLATQTYELVDQCIRRLDCDLAKFESEKAQNSTKKDENTVTKKKGRKKKEEKTKPKKGNAAQSDEEEAPTSKVGRKKQKKKTDTDSGITSVLSHTPEGLDMPVDPNEPTYCLCHQVSYGEMIACDKPDCPIEWFHFACVGLTTKPKGKWFCPKCVTERKKK